MSNEEVIEMSARAAHPAGSDVPHGAREADSDIKELLERVDEEHRRFLATVGQRISELELESLRARAMGERARQVVAEAEAEAAEIVQAAREEGDRLRADVMKEVQERAATLLESAHKEREALLAEAQQHAVRAPELRVLVEQMGHAFQQLSGAISAMAPQRTETALPAPDPPPEASLPLIGSRGEQLPPSPGSSDAIAADGALRPFRARPTRSWGEGSRPAGGDEEGSNGARRGWRFRDN